VLHPALSRSAARLLCVLIASICTAVPARIAAQGADAAPNPFADFESFRLGNGLKVWYRHLPGSTTTSMALIVPVGWDADHPGREQTAHFLEHVLLSDRAGRSEADLARELTTRGGSHNGITTPDHTFYPIHIGTDEAPFALRWLFDVVAPRVFTEDLLDRNREPVAIEIGARRRTLFERAALHYLHFPPLRPPGFWRREFGLETTADRVVDEFTSLMSITADDLQRFYDAYYVTPAMTLVIVSGAPRSALQPVIDSTFGMLFWRARSYDEQQARVRQSESRRYSWWLGRSTSLAVFHRVEKLERQDHLRLIFIEDLLRLRLMERLRRGADKSVYSVNVSADSRSGAAYVRIALEIDPRQEEFVREAIEREIERITGATRDTAAFYADRDALNRRLRVQAASPAALVGWATGRFYEPDLHDVFPDVGEYYATVGPDSIEAIARRVFTRDNRITRVLRPPPLPATWLGVLAGLLIGITVAIFRGRTLVPADMSRIRFVAHTRAPAAARIVSGLIFLVLALALIRLVAAAVQYGAEYGVLAIDSVALHAFAAAALLAGTAWTLLALAGRGLTKVLVFDHEVRLKSPTYRSVIIPASDILGASQIANGAALRLRRRPFGPTAGGVYLELRDHTGYLLHVRDAEGFMSAVARIAGGPADLTLPPSYPGYEPAVPTGNAGVADLTEQR
jgi:predicted Zn-dependent peptidase